MKGYYIMPSGCIIEINYPKYSGGVGYVGTRHMGLIQSVLVRGHYENGLLCVIKLSVWGGWVAIRWDPICRKLAFLRPPTHTHTPYHSVLTCRHWVSFRMSHVGDRQERKSFVFPPLPGGLWSPPSLLFSG